DSGGIRFGLGAVKNLGESALERIINNQPYSDIYDLIYKTRLNKGVLETLINSGTLSAFGKRKSLLEFLPIIIKATSMIQKDEQTLFGAGETLLPDILDTGEFALDTLLSLEKESLGFYVSSHPLDAYNLPASKDIFNINEGNVKITGLVTQTKYGCKNGKTWCYATVEDYSGRIGVLLFDKQIDIGQAYMFQGKAKLEEDSFKLFAYKANKLPKKIA
ncbi:MAG: hypothetical protein GX825_04550, partial [Syntrophomonadaceae bacterium]|nr:hypothetical protein [Syntrophomonadaceae bacterium]